MSAYIVSSATGRQTVADAGDLARVLAPWYVGEPAIERLPDVLQALDEALATDTRRSRRDVRRMCRMLLITLDALA